MYDLGPSTCVTCFRCMAAASTCAYVKWVYSWIHLMGCCEDKQINLCGVLGATPGTKWVVSNITDGWSPCHKFCSRKEQKFKPYFPPLLTPSFFCNLLVHKYLQQTFTGHQLYAGAAPGLVFKAPGQGASSLFLARFPCLPGAKALPGHAEQRSFLPLSYLRSPASRAMRRPKTFSLVSVALEFQDLHTFVDPET